MDTAKIRATCRQLVRDCLDARTGEVNSTKLAENACQALDGYYNDAECTIPEEFFEIASDVATDYENSQRGY